MKRANTSRETRGKYRLNGLCRILLSGFRIGRLGKEPKPSVLGMGLRRRPILSGTLSTLALLAFLFVSTYSTSHAALIEIEQHFNHPSLPPGSSCAVGIEGEIKQGDFDTFVDAIEQGWTLGCKLFSLRLSSPGGDLVEALKIGRLVRELAAFTYAPYSNIPGYHSCASYKNKRREGCFCFSACSLIWAGGVYRGGNEVYVHRPYFTNQLEDPFSKTSVQAYRSAFDLTSDYLREMNVSGGIIEKMLNTSSVEGSQLSKRELQMMESDPVYEEIILRECGPENKKNPMRQTRAEQKKTIARNACKSAFHEKHSDRLRSNAQNYINATRN